MRFKRLALAGAAFAIAALLSAQPSFAGFAASIASFGEGAAEVPSLAQPVFHGHSSRAISMYCYPRNYWWFYRPYTTAAENYPRCMPYFHYPPQAYRGRRAPHGMK